MKKKINKSSKEMENCLFASLIFFSPHSFLQRICVVRHRAKNADKTQPGICRDSIDMSNYFCLVNSECRSVNHFLFKYDVTSFIWPALLHTGPEKVCAAQLSLLAGSFLRKEIPKYLFDCHSRWWYTTQATTLRRVCQCVNKLSLMI